MKEEFDFLLIHLALICGEECVEKWNLTSK